MPTYTVIIPSQNRPELVQRALRSVYRQTIPALEILIIDDASEPPLTIPPEVADPRTRIIRNAKALGGAASRNAGLRAALGDCAAFLDDDDEWMPEKMERQFAHLHLHPGCVWVSCGYNRVQEGAEYPEIYTEQFVREFGEYDSFIGSFSFAVITREASGNFPLLDPSLPAFQDWDFFLKQRRRGAIGMVEEGLGLYHAHQSPRITNGRRNRMNGLRKCYFRHRSDLQPDARRWVLSRLMFDRAALAGPWGRKCKLTVQSVMAGWRCRLPMKVKGRALGKRLLSLGISTAQLESIRCQALALLHGSLHGRKAVLKPLAGARG